MPERDDRVRVRVLDNLEYRDAAWWLQTLSAIEKEMPPAKFMDPKVRLLRTNKLKWVRESRQAALLCYGLERRMGVSVRFAMSENADYDFVARYVNEGEVHLVPVQLKELVPEDINKELTLDETLGKLKMYVDSSDLTVGVYVNRTFTLDFTQIKMPNDISLAGLWLFGATSQNQAEWFIYGDLLAQPSFSTFQYPTVAE